MSTVYEIQHGGMSRDKYSMRPSVVFILRNAPSAVFSYKRVQVVLKGYGILIKYFYYIVLNYSLGILHVHIRVNKSVLLMKSCMYAFI